jgi:hypothetical protein
MRTPCIPGVLMMAQCGIRVDTIRIPPHQMYRAWGRLYCQFSLPLVQARPQAPKPGFFSFLFEMGAASPKLKEQTPLTPGLQKQDLNHTP